jgi:hypothetical protein
MLNKEGKNGYTVGLRLRKIREVLNHYLAYLKIINPSIHQIREGFIIKICFDSNLKKWKREFKIRTRGQPHFC